MGRVPRRVLMPYPLQSDWALPVLAPTADLVITALQGATQGPSARPCSVYAWACPATLPASLAAGGLGERAGVLRVSARPRGVWVGI